MSFGRGRVGRVTLAVCSFFLFAPVVLAAQEVIRPPNIIYILADDLGYGDIGAYAQLLIPTPNLDRMAREGMHFTQHYAGAPVCAPSRSVLMTGLHTGHTPIRGNFNAQGERVPLGDEVVTVAEVLRGAGYTSGIIGKWGLGEPGTAGVPGAQGFDYFYGFLNQRNAHSHYPPALWRNDVRESLPENAGGGRGVYAHDRFTDEALEFIDRNARRPFFLYLAYTLPHAEVLAPPDAVEPFLEHFPETEAHFAGMVARLDRDVGRLLDRLVELGLDQNTLVLFSSDNGPHAEGGHDPQYFTSSGGLRGIKRELYEGGIRVPLIAWWPGTVGPGSVSHRPSAFWDFLPTAAEIAGVVDLPPVDGISFAPTLRGVPQEDPPFLYWEFYEGTPAQAVRFGQWKAIRTPMHNGAVELYDLEADLYEVNDLAGERPGLVEQAVELMDGAHEGAGEWE